MKLYIYFILTWVVLLTFCGLTLLISHLAIEEESNRLSLSIDDILASSLVKKQPIANDQRLCELLFNIKESNKKLSMPNQIPEIFDSKIMSYNNNLGKTKRISELNKDLKISIIKSFDEYLENNFKTTSNGKYYEKVSMLIFIYTVIGILVLKTASRPSNIEQYKPLVSGIIFSTDLSLITLALSLFFFVSLDFHNIYSVTLTSISIIGVIIVYLLHFIFIGLNLASINRGNPRFVKIIYVASILCNIISAALTTEAGMFFIPCSVIGILLAFFIGSVIKENNTHNPTGLSGN